MYTTGAREVTPVVKINDIYFKRDDYYRPFSDIPLNGGKLRQCYLLLEKNLDRIRNEFNNTVSTASSVHSPQGIIVSRVAKHFGMKSILAIGNHKSVDEVVSRHRNIGIAREMGCEIRVVSKLGYNNVLYSYLEKQQEKEKSFRVLFGMNLEDSSSEIIESIMDQVQNIPKDTNTIVIPTGSGITAGCILAGMKKFGKTDCNVIMVQISGYSRLDVINNIYMKMHNTLVVNVENRTPQECTVYFGDGSKYQFIKSEKFPYVQWVKTQIGNDDYLDGRYEAKAFDWLVNNISEQNGRVLFWIIGNSGYFFS